MEEINGILVDWLLSPNVAVGLLIVDLKIGSYYVATIYHSYRAQRLNGFVIT